MIRGLYTAATGLNVQTKKMDVISNDLANVNTTGYKKDTTVIASFPQILASRLDDTQNQVPHNGPIGRMSLGARVDEVYTQFSQGSVIKTDEVVDVAIQGSGFFVIQTPGGTSYTRDGNFSINQLGNIVTKEGYSVMGQDGPISLGEDFLTTGGEVIIKEDGTIYKGTEYIDQLDLADFEDTRTLTKIDDNLFAATAPRTEFRGSIIQGYLEASTVNPVTAMVDMITVSRAYEANQKVVQTHDSLLGRAVNDIGKM
ncbi:flagellar basal-body rod protein FlgF [Sporanaerobium hydrogeniformans]|uniref:Flagellar basal-body rod protein FlgF n=1 Tax=Sporanaerobium hydrogeniformans TaxID=3072179 RepID=A0AC61DAA7_9FIRM|nr:flagellar basal-body rod protein FlgF [Sporanaerobium hydrogeniformans]PHV69845.1 flagellar basal-body rod protein FlgF [Sporanaerobium hydrogeniformans]